MEKDAPPRPIYTDRPHVPASEIAAFIHRREIEALLRPWLPDEGEREMVLRCLIEVGPAHHRGSNYILLRLLGLLLSRLPSSLDSSQSSAQSSAQSLGRASSSASWPPEWQPIVLRVPPSLHFGPQPDTYPLGLPIAVLDRLAPRGSRQQAAMLDCLGDGPPQHSLANAAMLLILDALLRAGDGSNAPDDARGGPGGAP